MIEMDLFYLKNVSLLLDLKIMLKTSAAIVEQLFESRTAAQPGRLDEGPGSPVRALQSLKEPARNGHSARTTQLLQA